MKLFDKYILPEVNKSVKYGVNSTTVIFDEMMNPSLFAENNIRQLSKYINSNVTLGDIKIKCNLTVKNYIGNRYVLKLTW